MTYRELLRTLKQVEMSNKHLLDDDVTVLDQSGEFFQVKSIKSIKGDDVVPEGQLVLKIRT
jgi:hypothetical protein